MPFELFVSRLHDRARVACGNTEIVKTILRWLYWWSLGANFS